jgi:formylglycine-generating enzyme
MICRHFVAVSFCALGVLPACRVAGPDELVGSVHTQANGGDAGVGNGGAPEEQPNAQRLPNVTCPDPTPAEPTKTVDVPASDFTMGCDAQVDTECKPDEDPAHPVSLQAFSIDATEVTQAQYHDCVNAGACLPPTCDWDPCGARAKHPIVCVNRADAVAYCKLQNKRLPTEAEWELAARGTAALKFPWGNDAIDCTHGNLAGCLNDTAPVGSYPSGASPFGALDMAGNVVEWVSDIYDPGYYAVSPKDDPQGPASTPQHDAFVGRGGGFLSTAIWHRASARDDYEGTYFKKTFGIRCAASALQ